MEVKTRYKQTEVGIIPEDWDAPRIDNVCKLINGRGFKPFEWKTTGLPIIRIQNLNGSDEFNYFDGSYDKKLEVDNGQLLFAWSGSRGTSFGPHIWRGSLGLLNYHTWKVQSYDAVVSKEFLLHALRQLTWFIEGKAHGAAALVHVQKWEMESFRFPLPPTFVEQEAIAEALSDADALIEALDELIAKKRQVKQGAMQELLSSKDNWIEKRLGNTAVLKARIGWQGLTTKEYLDSGDYYLITGTEFQDGYIDWSNCHYVNASRYKQDKNIQVREHDVLVTKDGTIGKVALITDLPKPATLNSGVFVIRPIEDAFQPEFFYYLLCSKVFTEFLNQLSAGSTINHLYQKDFVNFVYKTPATIEEQTAVAEILSDMDAEIAALEGKLTKARQVKQGMMSELLTGRVRLV